MFKIVLILYRNLVSLFQPVRSKIGHTLRYIKYRFIRRYLLRRNDPPFIYEKLDKKPEEFFNQDGACDDLAKLWYNFDLVNNVNKFKKLVEMFGTNAVIRTVDSLGWTVSHWAAETG